MQVQICEDAGVVGVVVPSHPGNWGELPKNLSLFHFQICHRISDVLSKTVLSKTLICPSTF